VRRRSPPRAAGAEGRGARDPRTVRSLRASFLLLCLCALHVVCVAAPAPGQPLDRFPGIAPAYAVIVDGRLTWGAQLDTPRPPASLVKLLTALTLLDGAPADGAWHPDDIITISAQAAAIEGSQVGLRTGERVRAEDLLTAMLVRSGNDACLALVEHAAGGIAAFLPRLNARARALGMTSSQFLHPCGLDVPGSHTTVRDLIPLARAALAQPQMALRGGAVEARIRTLAGRELHFKNSNALIGRDPEATGLKSGYTRLAGRCLIGVAARGPHQAIVVMLGAEERWWAASNLLVLGLAEAAATAAPTR
jgi:serine-type D-Ala-D-Ala carboxypeptidase (penicillin-binding protein 5/6)